MCFALQFVLIGAAGLSLLLPLLPGSPDWTHPISGAIAVLCLVQGAAVSILIGVTRDRRFLNKGAAQLVSVVGYVVRTRRTLDVVLLAIPPLAIAVFIGLSVSGAMSFDLTMRHGHDLVMNTVTGADREVSASEFRSLAYLKESVVPTLVSLVFTASTAVALRSVSTVVTPGPRIGATANRTTAITGGSEAQPDLRGVAARAGAAGVILVALGAVAVAILFGLPLPPGAFWERARPLIGVTSGITLVVGFAEAFWSLSLVRVSATLRALGPQDWVAIGARGYELEPALARCGFATYRMRIPAFFVISYENHAVSLWSASWRPQLAYRLDGDRLAASLDEAGSLAGRGGGIALTSTPPNGEPTRVVVPLAKPTAFGYFGTLGGEPLRRASELLALQLAA